MIDTRIDASQRTEINTYNEIRLQRALASIHGVLEIAYGPVKTTRSPLVQSYSRGQ